MGSGEMILSTDSKMRWKAVTKRRIDCRRLVSEPEDVVQVVERVPDDHDLLLEGQVEGEQADEEGEGVEEDVDGVADEAERAALHAVVELDEAEEDVEAGEPTSKWKIAFCSCALLSLFSSN